MFVLFCVTFLFFLILCLFMAVGLLFSKKPLAKGCGYSLEKKECSICHHKNPEPCEGKNLHE